ncbi:exosome complex exonuclease Mtr3 [Arctopsyche grandis]|uniref:exosome complex exonuclease Mtr3 n=1 Tax=Arctopsyche grandis TaxID=121162 RepID=UPI00406D7B90
MAPDVKRLSAPDSSTPYRLFSPLNTRTPAQLLAETFDTRGRRRDKRRLEQPRTIFGYLNAVRQAKGSAYVEMGKTKVVVTVYEPREMPKQNNFDGHGELHCEIKFAPFSNVKRVQLQPGPEEREMAATVKRALEPVVLRHLFPNFQVDIFAYILENDGGCLATVINAAGLALADAEIPIYDTVTALTVGVQGDKVIVDPNANEEAMCLASIVADNAGGNHGLIVKVMMPQMEQVTELWQRGSITFDTVLDIVDSHDLAYQNLYKTMRSILLRKCDQFLKDKMVKDANKTPYEVEIEILINNMSV